MTDFEELLEPGIHALTDCYKASALGFSTHPARVTGILETFVVHGMKKARSLT